MDSKRATVACTRLPRSSRTLSLYEIELRAAHNFVPAKISDKRVAGLHRMKSAARLRTREHFAQLHEAMAAAAGVESIHRDAISSAGVKGTSVG